MGSIRCLLPSRTSVVVEAERPRGPEAQRPRGREARRRSESEIESRPRLDFMHQGKITPQNDQSLLKKIKFAFESNSNISPQVIF